MIALYGLAECYLSQEDQENAIKYLEKTIEINPNYEDAKQLLEELTVTA